jgi:hypothetical protein
MMHSPHTDPSFIYRTRDAIAAVDALGVAIVHLDLFTALAHDPADVAGVCERFGVHPRPAHWPGEDSTTDWHVSMLDPAFAEAFTAAMDCRGRALAPALAATVDCHSSQRGSAPAVEHAQQRVALRAIDVMRGSRQRVHAYVPSAHDRLRNAETKAGRKNVHSSPAGGGYVTIRDLPVRHRFRGVLRCLDRVV